MRFLPLFALVATASNVGAGDLTAVSRTIVKEPAYRTKSPKYCLLAFGPEAKSRSWIVQDGDDLYVDRNCNGDLTEASNKIELKTKDKLYRQFAETDIQDGPLTHSKLSVFQMLVDADTTANDAEFARVNRQPDGPWTWWINIEAERPANDDRPLPKKIGYVANGDGRGYLLFGEHPQKAPIVHFNGPWTLGLQDFKQEFRPGFAKDLQIGVGTPGIGPGTFAFVKYPNTIPTDAYPVAEVTFPPPPDKKPRRIEVVLKRRC
jgi:hypothetical protein